MQIQKVQYNQQFNARFPKKDVDHLVKEAKFIGVDGMPQLYTLLDIVKNIPGKKAKIKDFGYWYQILIDGKSMTNKNTYISAFNALKDAFVNQKNSLLEKTPINRISEEEFENLYYKNSTKTAKDIKNIW